MVNVFKYKSIHDIEESTWNSIVPEEYFFHSYRFIQSIEDAKVEDSQFWYLLFYSEQKLVGSAALSAFNVSLDLFTGELFRKAVEFIRTFLPNFFNIKVLFCGLPISIGKHNLVISGKIYTDEIIKKLNNEMLRISDTEKINYLCIKEFDENFFIYSDVITNYGFLCVPSIPYVSMQIKWLSFKGYLNDLRHSYRRQIKQNLKKIGWNEPQIEIGKKSPSTSNEVRIVLSRNNINEVREYYQLYDEVMQRAEEKLEKLNKEFFKNLFKLMKGKMEVLSYIKGQEIFGYAILFSCDKSMTFVLVGLDYVNLKKYDVYLNLIYAILKLTIDRGCPKLDLGQTSYYSKQRIGGKCIKTYFFLKSKKIVIHSLLKIFKRWLFPELDIKTHRVFN